MPSGGYFFAGLFTDTEDCPILGMVSEAIDDRASGADEELVRRARESDDAAFRLLFERYQPVLFRSMLASVGDRDEAHEIVQETFVRVWDHRSSLRPDLPFLGYLLRIARNLLRDAAKRSAVRVKYAPEIPLSTPSAGDDPERTLRATMLAEALTEVVQNALPDRCREVFLLSRMEGWSNDEIARTLGISVKTVENQMTKALKIVRRELAARLGSDLRERPGIR